MFWRFGGYANISSIDSLLDKPDVTLEELLDESDLIQELKQQNSKLIEFLREEAVLHKLLRYVTADKPLERNTPSSLEDAEEKRAGITFFGKSKAKSRSRSKSVNKSFESEDQDEDKRESQRKKYAYVACEVLSSDVWSITESLIEYHHQLREFWSYMKRPAPLDALQAGYFTKVNEALFDKKTDEMVAFFKSLDNIIPQMLQHVECPMVMDLLLKVVTLEKHEGGQGIVDVSPPQTRQSIVAAPANLFCLSVVAITKPHPSFTLISLLGLQLGHSNRGRRLPKGYHYYIRQRYYPRSDCHWPQRAHQTVSVRALYQHSNS